MKKMMNAKKNTEETKRVIEAVRCSGDMYRSVYFRTSTSI